MPSVAKPPFKKRLQVALLIETSNSYARGLLRGIHAYSREHGPWATYLSEQEQGDAKPVVLKDDWNGDGILARLDNRWIAQEVKKRQRKVPIVDLCAGRLLPGMPCVETDDRSIARMAAEHLFERNFNQFGYYGDCRFNWARWRGEHFRAIVTQEGFPVDLYEESKLGRTRSSSEKQQTLLVDWVKSLPKPVGIMACHDYAGWLLLQACHRAGAAVPDEVAVIGVDNDETLCELSDPPLSSVVPDTFRTGYEAARLLDQMMSGKRVEGDLQIEPTGVVTRKSTDAFAVADPIVSQAVRFIREHACDGIKVRDVMQHMPISRASLDHEFKKLLGHTSHEEILRIQFQRVVELLTKSDLTLAEIAQRTGFKHPQYLTYAFKERYGVPPSEYRASSSGRGEN
jgi:LacI family transcriptional regulator